MRRFLRDERAVALLDMMVVCALIATFTIVFATALGQRPVRAHSAAMSLEMALSEARSVAAANANALDPAYPTGATVVVERDPSVQGASRIAVYRSRPVVIGGKQPFPPTRDVGFPAQRVSGQFQFSSTGSDTPIIEPFAIMLSGGGYASIVKLAGPYDEMNPQILTSDPGCAADGAQITVSDGDTSESHAFGCTGGAFHAS